MIKFKKNAYHSCLSDLAQEEYEDFNAFPDDAKTNVVAEYLKAEEDNSESIYGQNIFEFLTEGEHYDKLKVLFLEYLKRHYNYLSKDYESNDESGQDFLDAIEEAVIEYNAPLLEEDYQEEKYFNSHYAKDDSFNWQESDLERPNITAFKQNNKAANHPIQKKVSNE